VSYGVVKNAEIVTAGDGGFVNPFTTLASLK
jgi:hypothetical protein